MTGLSSSCGACKFLRRKCTSECVFAPYFGYDEAATHFAAVHKVFGASNVSKLLSHLPVQNRSEAAITISYEALARMWDPIYGCVAHILALQQQVASLQEEIEILGNQMANSTVDFSSCGNLQATSNLNNGLQYPSQLNDMNIHNYLNQQTPLFPHTGNTTANQAYDSQMTIQFPPVNGWEDKTSLSYSDSNPWERLLEAIDQDILQSFPSMNNGSDIFI